MKKLLLTAVAVTVLSLCAGAPAMAKSDNAGSQSAKDKEAESKAKAKEAEAKAEKEKADKNKSEKEKEKAEADEKAKAEADEKVRAEAEKPKDGEAIPVSEITEADLSEKGEVALLDGKCDLIAGCAFSGDDAEGKLIEAAFEAAFPMQDLDLTLLDQVKGNSGPWETKVPVAFISLQGPKGFTLYQLEKPSTFTEWSGKISDLVKTRGGAEGDVEVGSLSLWAGDHMQRVEVAAVPEPSTWAIMLCGFFSIGGMLRAARKKALRHARTPSTSL